MEEKRSREGRGIGADHYFNIHSVVECPRTLPGLFADSVRFLYVSCHGFEALYWYN